VPFRAITTRKTPGSLGIAKCSIWYYRCGMTTITLKIPPEIAAQLNAVVARKCVSKSKYVRDALIAALKKEKSEPSLYDLMKDGLGCFDSGKVDKSTNPKYMKGYGKPRSPHRHRTSLRAA
jgi:Arc/MetJ-type ribon-helix-helix transcriptional regulator